MIRTAVTVAALVLTVSQVAAVVLPSNCARPTGHWGHGSPRAIALIEAHPYPTPDPMVISGWGTVLSVSLVSNPHPVPDSSVVAPDVVHDLIVDDDLVYAALGPTGIYILRIDFEGPELLVPIARIPTPGEALRIALRDKLLAVAGGEAGARLYDLSDPVLTRSLDVIQAAEHISDLAYDESRLVVADGGHLRVLDVTQPSRPLELSTTETGDWLTRVEVRNGVAYVGSAVSVPWGISAGRFRAFDLTDPRHPVAGGLVNAGSAPTGFAFARNLVFVAYGHGLNTWDGALQTVNLDDPLDPELVGERIYDSAVFAVAATDHRTLVASNRIEVLDTIDPFDPSVLSTAWDDDLAAQDAVVCNGVLVIANDEGRQLRFVRLEEGRPEQETGRLDLATAGRGLACGGDVVFAGASLATAVDLSDPTHPRVLDTLVSSSRGSDHLIVDGDIVYAGGRDYRVVDARDPAELVALGTLDVPGSDGALAMSGHHLLAAYRSWNGEMRLRILDVSSPGAPVVVSDVALPAAFGTRWPTDVVVADGVAMILGHALATVDVTDPRLPVVLGIADLPPGGTGRHLSLLDDRLFVSQGTGVAVFDTADPAEPLLFGTFRTPGEACATVSVGDELIVLDGEQGVSSFDVSSCRPVVLQEPPGGLALD